MNCKPGDMAVVVGLETANTTNITYNGKPITQILDFDIRGVIVECVSVFADPEDGLPNWKVVERRANWCGKLPDGTAVKGNSTITSVPDRVLRPLRDNEGEDETLNWVGLPGKINQPELV